MGETGQSIQVKSSEQCLVPSKHSRGGSNYSCHPLSAGEEIYILCGLTDKLELKGIKYRETGFASKVTQLSKGFVIGKNGERASIYLDRTVC